MTRHPYRRDCDCDHWFAEELNAVLRRFLEQREDKQAEKLAAEVEALCEELREAR